MQPASAQQIVSKGDSFLSARFAIGEAHEDGRRETGLVMEIRPGWKTYWRIPGEMGVPPQLDWSRSENVAALDLDWPRPVLFESFGYLTLGYGGRVVMPITLTPADASQPMRLALNGQVGVCKDICVFETIAIETEIMPEAPGPDRTSIGVARLSLPEPGPVAGVSMIACRIAGAGEERAFSGKLQMPDHGKAPHVVLEGPEGSWFDDVTASPLEGGYYEVKATFHAPDAPAWIDRNAIVTTVLAGPLAAEVSGCAPAIQ
ncbi:MAG: protein-disulfide reductase DsbD domain-containing protein [Pseudomonadota bacterium]